MDFINICQCGTQHGYAHPATCPFPYYGNDQKRIDEWQAAKGARSFLFSPCTHPQRESLSSGEKMCIVCGDLI